jgi:MYXO-CTERM domain-containing protein
VTPRAFFSLCALACLCLAALPARADGAMSNRWFYEISNDNRDVHFTLQLIDDDPPNFDTTFTLTRFDDVVFAHEQFVKEEADEVFGPGCIVDVYNEGILVADCDGDGTDDCAGICGTAYRYHFVDECVPEYGFNYIHYALYDDATSAIVGLGGGVYWGFVPDDDSCLDAGDTCSDGGVDEGSGLGSSGCSVGAVSGRTTERGLAAFMLLVGLGFAAVARRRRSR